jgi:hypothetical protein
MKSMERGPRLFGDWERLKEAIWLMMSCFGASTSIARLNKLFN